MAAGKLPKTRKVSISASNQLRDTNENLKSTFMRSRNTTLLFSRGNMTAIFDF